MGLVHRMKMKSVLLLVAVLTIGVMSDQVHRFSLRTEADKVLLEGFVSDHQGSEFWDHSPRHSDVLLKDSHLDDAKLMALERTVFISDVDSLIQLTGKAQANANADFHSRYHASATYTQFLEKLASEHPNRASVVKLGKSVFGKEITGLRIGDQSKPEILIQGAQHAREWIAPGALAYLAEHVVKDHSMLGDYSLMVVPVVNPDGYDFSASHNRMWRKNIDGLPKNLEEEMLQSGHSSEELLQGQCFGTDLNRNWITADKIPQVILQFEDLLIRLLGHVRRRSVYVRGGGSAHGPLYQEEASFRPWNCNIRRCALLFTGGDSSWVQQPEDEC